jgi:hypothetical protein
MTVTIINQKSPNKVIGTSWICSIDIGSVNFAFYIEEINVKELESVENIPLKDRYNANGTPTCLMQSLLNKVYLTGKTILHINSDISTNSVKGKKLDQNTLYNLFSHLDNYSNYWYKCDSIIVEQQMNFGAAKRNTNALIIGHHCQAYFMIQYRREKKVLEFPAYHKTQVIGCEKIKGKMYKNGNYKWTSVNKPTRKKWGVIKATEILRLRGEELTLKLLNVKKADDLADTFLQLQAYKYLFYVDKSI